MVCVRLCERAYSSSEWCWFSITTEEAALLAYTVHTLGKGWKGVRLGLTGLIEHGLFFCLPGAPYFLLPVYPGRGWRKEFQKRISLFRMHKLWQHTHTHTNSRAYCAQQRTKKQTLCLWSNRGPLSPVFGRHAHTNTFYLICMAIALLGREMSWWQEVYMLAQREVRKNGVLFAVHLTAF